MSWLRASALAGRDSHCAGGVARHDFHRRTVMLCNRYWAHCCRRVGSDFGRAGTLVLMAIGRVAVAGARWLGV